jgi:uncharacterized protein (DUF2147 family)
MQLKSLRLIVLAAATTVVPAGPCLLSSVPAAAAPLPREVGVWIDDTGDGAVKIDVCGNTLCGKIVWLRNPLNDEGKPKHDRHNPEPSQQNRPICGLPVLGDLTSVPEGGFDNGWVYDPKEGKSYSVAIVAQSADQLSVTGYKGIKLLGKTFMWTRSKTDLPSCAVLPASAEPTSAKTNAAAAAGAGAAAATAKKAIAKPAVVAAPAAGNVSAETDRLAPAPPKASVPKAQAPATTEAAADPDPAPSAAPVQKKSNPVIQKKVQTTTTTSTAAATKSDTAGTVTDKKTAPAKKKPAKAETAAKPAVEKLPWATNP